MQTNDDGVFVVKLDQAPKPGWPCPRCGGSGHNCDGWLSISQTEIRSKTASKCYLCDGSGRVNVTPIK
jgi:hypothetical protein